MSVKGYDLQVDEVRKLHVLVMVHKIELGKKFLDFLHVVIIFRVSGIVKMHQINHVLAKDINILIIKLRLVRLLVVFIVLVKMIVLLQEDIVQMIRELDVIDVLICVLMVQKMLVLVTDNDSMCQYFHLLLLGCVRVSIIDVMIKHGHLIIKLRVYKHLSMHIELHKTNSLAITKKIVINF
jgi:hypothetical protein